MRADAQRNAEKLRIAAAALFHERGLQVSLKEIASRAGVSHGTLYNLFGTREVLIDAVVADVAAERLGEVAEKSLAYADAWDGFVYYIEAICELQTVDPAVADVVAGRYPDAERLMAVCAQATEAAGRIIERAQHAGELRSDFTTQDLLFVFGANALLARAAAKIAPDAWRRSIAILLDGLRADAARPPLPVGPLTPEQVATVLVNLGNRP